MKPVVAFAPLLLAAALAMVGCQTSGSGSVEPSSIKIQNRAVGPGVEVDIAYFAYNSNSFDVTVKFMLSGNGCQVEYDLPLRSGETVQIGLVDPRFVAKQPIHCPNAYFSVVGVWRA